MAFEDYSRLRPLDKAHDVYEATGIWWARAILHGNYDAPFRPEYPPILDDPENVMLTARHKTKRTLEMRNTIEKKIGIFSLVLASMAEEEARGLIVVEIEPDHILSEAAIGSDLDFLADEKLFPFYSLTQTSDETVMARSGYHGRYRVVWPPRLAKE